MNMIDVLTRLAELDAKNPNIVKENADLAECGPMGMMGGMSQPQTPASVNITAGSGQELSAMLKDIMSLAGIHKVEPEHLGIEHDPMTLTAEPVAAVGPMPTAGDDMRSVIDKLNPDTDGEQDDGEEVTDEGPVGAAIGGNFGWDAGKAAGTALGTAVGGPVGGIIGGGLGAVAGGVGGAELGDKLTGEDRDYTDNSGNKPTSVPSMNRDAMLNKGMQSQENPKNAGFGRNTMQPNANATAFESLMAEYKKFVAENRVDEISPELAATVAARRANQVDQMAHGEEDPLANDQIRAAHDQANKTWDQAVKRGATNNIVANALNKVQNEPPVPLRSGGQTTPTPQGFKNPQVQYEESETVEIGQKMANDGITYSAEKQNEIIGLMTQYMKKAGMNSKSIRYLLSYDKDYIPDQLSYLPKSNDNSMTKK